MDFIPMLFFFLVIIPSAIFHEYMHGWAANQMGDPTAKYAGRLTLDPRAHVDPFGTLLMPAVLFLISGGSFLFAYAKPVPFNPYNLKNQKWGPALVGIAGPAANFLLAFVFGIALQLFPDTSISPIFGIIVYANVLLAVFNLVPIPPLDGSKILFAVLPDSMWQVRQALEKYGFFILLFFIFFMFQFLFPIIIFFYNIFTGGGAWFF
jgi:Zn-dependent protease